jgi:stalled ribosome rescue protein Dom34
MSFHTGTAVWIDHHEARVYHVAEGAFDETTLKAPGHHLHRHPKGATAEHNHPEDLHRFFAEVEHALEGAERILVVGPGTAKLQLLRHAREHARAIESHIVGVESCDHPTEGQLVAHINHYFHVKDR